MPQGQPHRADPATQEKLGQQARAALGAARRGVSTVVERIDPGVLADLIIKATALQEMTNASLREKKSPYRITEVAITASIPPGHHVRDRPDRRRRRSLTGDRGASRPSCVDDAGRDGRGGHRARRHDA